MIALWRVVTEGCATIRDFWDLHRSLTDCGDSSAMYRMRETLLSKLSGMPADVFTIIIGYAARDNLTVLYYGGRVFGELMYTRVHCTTGVAGLDDFVVCNETDYSLAHQRKSHICLKSHVLASDDLTRARREYLRRFINRLCESTHPDAVKFRLRFNMEEIKSDPLQLLTTSGQTGEVYQSTIPNWTSITPLFINVVAGTIIPEGLESGSRYDEYDEYVMSNGPRSSTLREFLQTTESRVNSEVHATPYSPTAVYQKTIWYTLEQMAVLSDAFDFPF